MRLLKRGSNWSLLLLVLFCYRVSALDQSSSAPTRPSATPAATMQTDVPLNLAPAGAPSAEDLSKGDPEGTKTGTVNDIAPSDPKKGLTLADTLNQVGQNKIAINFTWTLIAGF